MAKLTMQQVVEARRSYADPSRNESAKALARLYGVCEQAMWDALRGRTFAYVPGAVPRGGKKMAVFNGLAPKRKAMDEVFRSVEEQYSALLSDGDVRLTANIRQDLHLKLKIAAAMQRTTIGELIEELIERHLTEPSEADTSPPIAGQSLESIADLKAAMDQALLGDDEEAFNDAQAEYLAAIA